MLYISEDRGKVLLCVWSKEHIMGIKAKILKELQKKPRRLKELKAKLGNDKKVARAVD